MTTVTVSPKYQVMIPAEVRQSLGITPGERFQVLHHDGRLELIAVRAVRDMKGVRISRSNRCGELGQMHENREGRHASV